MMIPDVPIDMNRVNVLGSTGSGKSTMAKSLSAVLGAPHVELDALRFLPGWITRSNDDFRSLVDAATSGPRWVSDGNYRIIQELTWGRADTAVFLDLPLPLILWRITKRTVRRTLTREDLWGTGNRDNIFKHFRLSDESLYYWAIKVYRRRRREILAAMQQPEHRHLRYIHLTSPRQIAAWLAAVQTTYRVS